jgi:hypothetical protein
LAFPAATPLKKCVTASPARGFFAILRLYGPGERAIDYSWKPGDFVKQN